MCTLFIVDDNETDHFIIKTNISKFPIFEDVSYFDDGKSLINFLKENKDKRSVLPDIIFLDLYMPIVSGWNVLEEFQKIYSSLCKEISVYVLTASVNSHDRLRVSAFNFVEQFITKPVSRQTYVEISQKAETICDETAA